MRNVLAFFFGVLLAALMLLPFAANAAVTYFSATCSGLPEYKGSAEDVARFICSNVTACNGATYTEGSYSRYAIGGTSPRYLNTYCNYLYSGSPRIDSIVLKTAYETTTTSCPTGLVLDVATGVCRQPNECDATAGQVVSSGMYDLGTDSNATPPTTTCDGTCELSYTGSGVVARQLVGGEWHYFSEGSYTRTAASCAENTAIAGGDSLPPPSCDPATQDQGTVNGRFVCLERTTTKTTTSDTVTNPDGSTTTTTVEADTATGEQTTTTTTTQPDGSSTSSTVTEPIPGTSDPFCVANPTHETCRKDDIPWGDIPGAETLPELGIPVSTSYSVIGGEGSCPADASVSFMGQQLTWSYSPLCTFAQAVRPILIGLAWLGFGFIVLGAVRS